MKKLLKEIANELRLVLTGKTVDILVPPILFFVLNILFGLMVALIGSLLLSTFLTVHRLFKKENIYYAVGGFIAVLFAIMMSLLNNNASNFFLPDLIATLVLILATITSLIIKKPLTIWVSHITRGWDIKWFFRDDVYPAYKEVTYFWLSFFVVRFAVELFLYLNSSVENLIFANIIMGYPLLILVLTISYIYGISRLRKLNGPGIDEFMNDKEPPYRGQTRGF